MKKLLAILVVFALGFVAGIVWYRDSGQSLFEDKDPKRTPSAPTSTDPRVDYSDAIVTTDERGNFSGSIRLTNNTDRSMPVLVTLHIYNGPDNIADLVENTTMKPDTTSTVDLTSFTPFEDFSDITVDLMPLG